MMVWFCPSLQEGFGAWRNCWKMQVCPVALALFEGRAEAQLAESAPSTDL